MNATIADQLREAATLLHQQGANPFRVGAYRRAADTVLALSRDVAEIFVAEGTEGLEALPGIGEGIAGAIREIIQTGRWSLLQRLRGRSEPEQLFQTLPGVGPELARRLHDALGVDTLEALEAAAWDGRVEAVEGIGPRRAAALRATLGTMLGRRSRPQPPDRTPHDPGIGLLLDVDREYREKAEAGELPTIAPRRFNPEGEAWLPILHADRGAWHFTALFSNTGRAHELGRTRDWVVLYFYDDRHREGQSTVVTERRGPLAGRRVVRGRDAECRAFYAGSAG
jgi:DNA polymerase (family 10)